MRIVNVTCDRCGLPAYGGEWSVTGYNHRPFEIKNRIPPDGAIKVVGSSFDLCDSCKERLIIWLNEVTI